MDNRLPIYLTLTPGDIDPPLPANVTHHENNNSVDRVKEIPFFHALPNGYCAKGGSDEIGNFTDVEVLQWHGILRLRCWPWRSVPARGRAARRRCSWWWTRSSWSRTPTHPNGSGSRAASCARTRNSSGYVGATNGW